MYMFSKIKINVLVIFALIYILSRLNYFVRTQMILQLRGNFIARCLFILDISMYIINDRNMY
jgi:hypothetical protein